MSVRLRNLFSVFIALSVVGLGFGDVFAQTTNPRSAATARATSGRTDDPRSSGRTTNSRRSARARTTSTRSATTVSRTATPAAGTTNTRTTGVAGARGTASGTATSTATAARAASSNVVRAATSHNATTSARSAVSTAGIMRAGATVARATAVFDDVSKIGGGYATCREAYATCMDQLCAKANDTYRRCYCSARFTEFRDMESALDRAKVLLRQFEDNNLNAVDKTAAEVNAMYVATIGEAAIKKDVSSAAKTLSEIGDLLSGKAKATQSTASGDGRSLGVLSFDLTSDIDDIWGNGGSSSIFSNNSTTLDLSAMEGVELYNAANRQCLELISDACENNAVLNMATSSYNILIAQDCNAYEKKVNSQKEAVQQTVRTAEKYLREARLDEYRAHNSADVNECIAKVKAAITADVACGANYKKCLDYTGAYINTNGEPIYTPRLFELNNLIKLDSMRADVLSQNTQFNSFLESRKMFAATALDSCRDISATVWEEFKRGALIEIAQAQDAKIEEVKMSCVSTMKECYDMQSQALKNFDDTTSKSAGALSVYAARSMCQDKVIACASLYGDTSGCTFDGNGRLTSGNGAGGTQCGLTALLNFVNTVDDVRVAEGCATAIDNYVRDLCKPTGENQTYPWGCRTKAIGDVSATTTGGASLADNIRNFAVQNCADPNSTRTGYDALPAQTKSYIVRTIQNVSDQLEEQLMDVCDGLDGYWVSTGNSAPASGDTLLRAFYGAVYNGNQDNTTLGRCVENSVMVQCLNYNSGDADDGKTATARYDAARDECVFSDEWYKSKCELDLGGYYDGGVCYVAQ